MSYFKMFEDPMYDDDGQVADEDFDWQDQEDQEEDEYGPYATVNS
jgi:hypothetical protein